VWSVSVVTAAVVVVGVVATVALAQWRADEDHRQAQRRFEELANETARVADQQLTRDADELVAAAAFQAAVPDPTKAAFVAYGQTLGLSERVPPFDREGLSYVAAVTPDEVPGFTAARRADGSPDFLARLVDPLGGNVMHAVVAYTTPATGTTEGVDLMGSDARRTALEQSRDTGTPVMTEPLTLLSDDVLPPNERSAGVELYAPVYRAGLPTATVEQRRDALVGWVTGSTRVSDFVDGLHRDASDQIGFSIHDIDGVVLSTPSPATADSSERTTVVVESQGRKWLFDFVALPGFAGVGGDTQWAILIGGIATTLMLAALVFVLASQRRRLVKEVDAAVRDSEQLRLRFQSIFDHGPLGVIMTAPDGTILASNPQMDAMLGNPDPPYRTVFDGVIPEAVEQAKRWLHQLISGELEQLAGEGQMRRADGSRLWVRLSFRVARDADGNAVAVVGHVADITREREERERLRLAEERFRNAFAHATTAMAVLATDGRYLQVNDALCAIAGRSAEELQGMQSLDIRHPDDRALALTLRRPFLEGHSDVERIEGRFLRPDGSVVWGRTSVSPVRNADGSIAYFVSLTEDVTAQRDAEAALQARQRWFEALVEHATDVVCLLDRDGYITWTSPSASRVLGYPDTDESEVEPEPFFTLVHPDDRERVKERFEEAVRQPGIASPVEFRIQHADGTWRHFETLATNMLDDPAVRAVVTNSRDVSERVEATAQVAHRALHDPLTGLANRQLLTDRLGQSLGRSARSGHGVAVFYLDLDGFKEVNDQLGHGAGDMVLVTVGERLRATVRPGDTVARIGGDEFVVLAESMEGSSEALMIGERIRLAVCDPVRCASGQDVTVTTSIGIAVGGTGATPERLLHDADAALYRAKRLGKDRCELFDAALQAQSIKRLGTELLLRQALEHGDLVLHYQPVIELATGRTVSIEALLRLVRPTGELVGPQEFLAVAEETGLIVTIGAGVLDGALRAMREWRAAVGDHCPARVSVNMSARQLTYAGLVGQVVHVLSTAGASPRELSIEVSESALRNPTEATIAALRDLRAMGIAVGLDDFGAGPASLMSLRELPVDFVKIDHQLIEGLDVDEGDAAIVRAIIELARSLGLVAVAEGVERHAQVERLRELGCDCVQGFLFAAPEPAAVVEHALRRAASSHRS
jgi:diguanylate cyclase (GGDEF)-like protein/PAS domain S-box-containing protein